MYDISETTGVLQTLAPQDIDADDTVLGEPVDLAGFHAAMVVLDVGTYDDGTHAFTIQHALDDGTGDPDGDSWADVTAPALVGMPPVVAAAGAAEQLYRIGYLGDRPYLRVKVDTVGVSGDGLAPVAAYVVIGKPAHAPIG